MALTPPRKDGMTKKHFVEMAKTVKFGNYTDAEKLAAVKMFAEVAKHFNGRFNKDKFFDAAGVKEAA